VEAISGKQRHSVRWHLRVDRDGAVLERLVVGLEAKPCRSAACVIGTKRAVVSTRMQGRSSVAIYVPAWMDAERGACLGASAVERASVYSSVAPVGNEGRLEGAVVSTGMQDAPG